MVLGMFAPATVLALPLLDVLLALGRRFLRRVPLFSADRGHIHHVMQDRGFKPKAAALVLYGACTIAAILSVVAQLSPHIFHVAGLILAVLLALAGIRYLDYVEFRAIGKVFSSARIRRRVSEEIYLRELEIELTQMQDLDDCWKLVQRTCAELNFATVEMYFQNLYFDAVLDEETHGKDWWITLPVGVHGYVRVSRSSLLQTEHLVMPALDRLHRGLDKWERHNIGGNSSSLQRAA
jgi:UDP-GlcNAc:undecaprenyl-phosphate GlcNAc-1-phosphate transferase